MADIRRIGVGKSKAPPLDEEIIINEDVFTFDSETITFDSTSDTFDESV